MIPVFIEEDYNSPKAGMIDGDELRIFWPERAIWMPVTPEHRPFLLAVRGLDQCVSHRKFKIHKVGDGLLDTDIRIAARHMDRLNKIQLSDAHTDNLNQMKT